MTITRLPQPAPPMPRDCSHQDFWGSAVIFLPDRPADGVCTLCGKEFPAPTPPEDDGSTWTEP